jgi:hypothetical protein
MVGLVPAWSLLPWLLALGSIPLSVAIGLLAARVPASAYKALVYVPLYIIRAVLTARRMWRFGEGSWVRTERQAAPETVMDQV